MTAADALDVTRWLRDLGLEQYAAAFAANDVDAAVLPTLSADDLREIGVESVGHRRRILTAAAALGDEAAPAATAAQEAERRTLTVLFCDLADSTTLASELDLEDFRDLLANYRRVLEAAVLPYDGHVAQYLGDGVVVYFGYRVSREHDAENAVAAGLEIIRRVEAMEPLGGRQPGVRVGIATGLTVVAAPDRMRELVGDNAVGEPSNLAARLQSVAEPNTVVVSGATRDRLGTLFELEDLGALPLKGFARGVRAWRVLRHSSPESRFEALRPAGRIADFVGRSREQAELARQFALARPGRCRISVITGEGGFGKSRLARRALEQEGLAPAEVPVLQCTPYNVATPLQPIRYYLGKQLALSTAAGPAEALERLAGLLETTGLAGAESLALVAETMRLDPGPTPSLDGLSSQERRARTLALLVRLLRAIAGGTAAIVIEDLQWIDPTTVEVLERLLPEVEALPLHVIATMRPGRVPDWLAGEATLVLPLERLSERHLGALIRAVGRSGRPPVEVPAATARLIAARCDGSPVFAEELTRVYLEALADGRDLGSDLTGLPATLADSLQARLDRLTVGRGLALVGAVIASEFPVAVLLEVAGMPEPVARAGIRELLDAGVLQVGHSPFGEAVSFRHLLLREAAYQLLLRRDRLALHARTAEVLKSRFPRIADALPQVVALHLDEAGAHAEAAEEWERAGALAARRSAYAEAATHYARALEALGRGPPDAEAGQRELACRLGLMSALTAARGFTDAAVTAEMERIDALARRIGAEDRLIPALFSKWVVLGAGGDLAGALAVARKLCGLSEGGSEVDRLLAHRVLGTSLVFLGQLDDARDELAAFLALYDAGRHEAGLDAIGTSNHALMSMIGLAEIATLNGDAAAAAGWCDRARAHALDGGRAHDICNASLFLDCVLPSLGDAQATVERGAARLRSLSVEHDLPMWRGYAEIFAGAAEVRLGRVEAGLRTMERAAGRLTGGASFLDFCFLFQAEACLEAGEAVAARAALTRAEAAFTGKETWLSAELGRVGALVGLAEDGDARRARERLAGALALAERQGARLLAARVRRSVASLALAASR